jgi:hypothetical protein
VKVNVSALAGFYVRNTEASIVMVIQQKKRPTTKDTKSTKGKRRDWSGEKQVPKGPLKIARQFTAGDRATLP